MAGVAAAAEPAAVAAALSGLLADVAASVRPTLDEEKRDRKEDPDLGKRPARIRRSAEALLAAAERVNAPALRQQHAALWPALAAELDRHLTEACYASFYGDDDWEDDHSILWSRLKDRPSAQAVAVKSSLGSQYGRGAVSAGDSFMALITKLVPLERLKEIEGTPGYSEALEAFAPKNAASRQRPELASPLSRFDPSYDAAPAAAGGGGSAGAAVPGGSSSSGSGAGAAVAEARCEVTFTEVPRGGWLAAKGDLLAFAGGAGWKKRSPFLLAGRISGGEQAAAAGGAAGLSLALDEERDLVWASGGEPRIKAFAIDSSGDAGEARSCRHTLAGSNRVLAVAGGRVLAAGTGIDKGRLLYWDVDRLTPQRGWIGADELAAADEEDEDALRQMFGCQVLNMLEESMNDDLMDNAEEVEVTWGDDPHGRVPLQAADKEILQLVALGGADGGAKEPKQVAAMFENSNSVWVYDWPSGRLCSLLTGQLGNVATLSACPTLPHTIAAGSYDGSVRVWDLRSSATTHMLTSRSSMAASAVALAEDEGVPFCFTAQRGGEAILAWDLRAPSRCLYELATGNTDVISLQWHARSRSLFAATECDYLDRHGGRHDQGAIEGYHWPECMHRPSDFGHAWDAMEHLIIRFAFKDAPDLSVLPPEAEPDSEMEEYSDSEEDDDDNGSNDGGDEGKEQRRAQCATFRRRSSPSFW